MARARDKLQEAEFFLEKARQSKEPGPEFRYYFNASVSAFRAISFVLQKDFRSIHGSEFEEWWTRTKAQPPLSTLDFKALVHVRNVSQKEGSQLPLVILSGRPGEHLKELVENIEIVQDPSAPGDRSSIKSIKISLAREHPLLSITTENDVPEEEVARLMEERMIEILQQITRSLDVTLELSGLRLEQDGPTLTREQVLALLDDQAKAWREVLDEAEQQFRRST
jgi:hypothetical protein